MRSFEWWKTPIYMNKPRHVEYDGRQIYIGLREVELTPLQNFVDDLMHYGLWAAVNNLIWFMRNWPPGA